MSPETSPRSLDGLLETGRPYVLSLFRIVVGLLFFCHGASSLLGWMGGAMGTGKTVEAGTWPGWYAAVIQLVGGALVMLGLGTRIAAFICSGSMAYAYFHEHQPEKLWPLQNGGEASAMFCWAFFLIVFTGPGPWALDRIFGSSRASAAAAEPRRQPSAV
ncbi:DoxX family protein [Streptomyces botrytidirepellens]|uniref:DoxX family protein n=1 Tax=Streptomyces botrytidirepellens TaxID=2486417 RepID=A0A3M8VKG9_9ACTN|nr:DoxX family protein [Streptomyces botrytidirepellens]RNG18066.1 DoxX family protein [Streptomyces botrytidirepellens]